MDIVLEVGNRLLWLVLLLSAGPVLVATVVGLLVGLLQTVVQLQEQTLPYGAKLLALIVCLVVLMDWMSARMLEFSARMLEMALKG